MKKMRGGKEKKIKWKGTKHERIVGTRKKNYNVDGFVALWSFENGSGFRLLSFSSFLSKNEQNDSLWWVHMFVPKKRKKRPPPECWKRKLIGPSVSQKKHFCELSWFFPPSRRNDFRSKHTFFLLFFSTWTKGNLDRKSKNPLRGEIERVVFWKSKLRLVAKNKRKKKISGKQRKPRCLFLLIATHLYGNYFY